MIKVYQFCTSFGGFVPVLAQLVQGYIKHLRGSHGRFVPVYQFISKLVAKIKIQAYAPIHATTPSASQFTEKLEHWYKYGLRAA